MNKLIFKPKWQYRLSPAFFKALITWWLFVFLIFHASATSIVTDPVTSITTNSATFNGNLTLTTNPTIVWFQYGMSGYGYMFRTDNQTMTANGTFTDTVTGMPLISAQIYKVQAVYDDGNGTTTNDTQLFTLTPVPTTTYGGQFDQYSQELLEAKLNITKMSTTTPKPYTDIMGSLFWGFLFGMMFLMMFMKQDDVSIPSLVGLLIGGSLWSFMPEEYVSMAYSLTIVSFAGLMFSLIKSKM